VKDEPLEKICEFAKQCSESDYGSEEACKTDYENCPQYKRFQKELDDLDKEMKLWNWWR
jgi:hypothetical protein